MTKRAIVTGASSGIGREAAILLANEGIELVLAARRENMLREVAAGLSGAAAVGCDVSNPAECKRLVEQARALEPAYPVLVSCAGAAEFGDFAEMAFELVRRQLEVNLMGPLALCHAAIPWMLEQGGGQIINVGSIAAVH